MAKYQRFEDMPVWQEAARLYQRVLDIVEESNVPLSATFRNQLERAALCISNCVAEGFDGVATNDMRGLLSTARGAAAEVQSMVGIVCERPKVARLRDSLQQVRASAESCARQLAGWKYALENPGQKRQAAESAGESACTGSEGPGANGPGGRWQKPSATGK